MTLWGAILLGLAGSLHCAGMCGALALAVPADSRAGRFAFSRVLYSGGRLLTYGMLGAIFGILGEGFTLAGWQRGLSLIAGTGLLLGLILARRVNLNPLTFRIASSFRARLNRRQPVLSTAFILGMLNGLLPCGLVYVALAGAIASGKVLQSALTMLAFGAGTLPMMLGIALTGRRMQFALRLRLQKLIPISIGIVAAMLILRGLALDIPYLSPKLTVPMPEATCH